MRPSSVAIHIEVYGTGVGRTNIEIDDALVRRVMEENDLPTKRAAVDFALRQVVRRPLPTDEQILALEGIGWDGDLSAMRDREPVGEW